MSGSVSAAGGTAGSVPGPELGTLWEISSDRLDCQEQVWWHDGALEPGTDHLTSPADGPSPCFAISIGVQSAGRGGRARNKLGMG